MTIKKIKLVSNNICFGPMPDPDTEVEQHLTINEKGQVWLSRYRYADGESRYPLVEKAYLHIKKNDAVEILRLSEAVTNNQEDLFVTDVGVWELIETDIGGNESRITGSMIDVESKPINDFCRIIRSALGRSDLFLLDGSQ